MKKIDVNVEKEYSILPSGDPEGSRGSTKKMENLLSIKLNDMVSIGNGLSETLQFIRSNQDNVSI